MRFLAILLAFLIVPSPSLAGPVGAAISVFAALVGNGAAFGAAFSAAFGLVGKVVVGLGLSLVSQMFRKEPKVNARGIQTEQTTTGDVTPQKFVVGRYGLEGHAVAPAYSHGNSNKYLTYILEVSNIPVKGLTGRVAIDGEWMEIDPDAGNADADYGAPLLGLGEEGKERGWIIFHDGTQTAADTMLVDKYSAHPDRPWTADHILTGTAYAILTFELDQEVFSGLPSVLFEVEGISLYDPRKDTSVGGSGAHRWSDPGTWEFTENPQVINYNIFRGITLPTGDIYGGQVSAEDLPLDAWFAAMNECDVMIGDRVTYRAGFEIDVEVHEPFDIITEMNRASFTQVSEFGGVFRPRTGPVGTPVMSLTDGDIVISEPEELDAFPGLADTANGITGTYVEPTDVYQGRSSESIFNSEWEEEDGGRRLTLDMGMPAVTDRSQAQHLLDSFLTDDRRFRVHRMVLPPSFAQLEPLDAVEWSSARNGYTDKTFEVVRVEDRADTLLQFVVVRERDAGDVAWTSDQDLPSVPSAIALTPPDITVPTLSLLPVIERDDAGNDRRGGIELIWLPAEAPEAKLLKYQIRRDGEADLTASGAVDSETGRTRVFQSLIPGAGYQVRAMYVLGRRADWSPWKPVTVPGVLLGEDDIVASLVARIDTAFDRHDEALADAMGTVGDLRDGILANIGVLPGFSLDPLDPLDPLNPLTPPERLSDRIDWEIARLNFEIPRITNVDRSVDDALERLIELQGKQFTMARTLSGAGIFIDEETGEVRITAFESAEHRVSNVEINLSAIEAEIGLKASVAYVNQTVSEAVLDPTQIPVLNDLEARVTDAEILINAETGRIDTLVSNFEVDGSTVTMTEVSSTLDGLQGQITDRVTNSEFDVATQRITAAEQTLEAFGDSASITDTVEASRRALDSIGDLAEQSIADLWNRWKAGEGFREAAAQGRRELRATVDNLFAAEASERLQLRAEAESGLALLQQEMTVRQSETESLSESVLGLSVTLDDVSDDVVGTADAVDILTARVSDTEDGLVSLASSRTLLEATVGTQTRTLESALDDLTERTLGEVWDRWSADQDTRGGVSVALRELDTRVVEGLSAEAGERFLLGAALDQAKASIVQESRSRADEDEALGQQITSLSAGLNTAEGNIIDLQATRVTEAEAIAAVETEISASFDGLTAMATATAFAKATADGISAGYVWRLNNENVLEAVSVESGTGGVTSTFLIAADYVKITGLTQIDNAVMAELAAENAFINNLEVGTLNIAENAVVVPSHAQFGTVTQVTTEATWTTGIAYINITRTSGIPTQIEFGGQLGGIEPVTGNGDGGAAIRFRVLRDGVVISENLAHTSGYRGSRNSFSFTIQDNNTDSGNAYYAIQAQRVLGAWTGRVPQVISPWIRATQYKR